MRIPVIFLSVCFFWQCAQEKASPETSRRRGSPEVVKKNLENNPASQTTTGARQNVVPTATCEPYEVAEGDECRLLSFRELCDINLPVDYQKTMNLITQALEAENCRAAAMSLESMDELHIPGPPQGASGIGTLARTEQQISQLGPFATLQHLKILNLENHLVSDWKPLKHLKDLEELYLSFNKIRDLNGVVLQDLRKLGLRGNDIRDVSALANFFLLGSGVPESKGLDLRDNPLGNTIEKNGENCPSDQRSPAPLKRFCRT